MLHWLWKTVQGHERKSWRSARSAWTTTIHAKVSCGGQPQPGRNQTRRVSRRPIRSRRSRRPAFDGCFSSHGRSGFRSMCTRGRRRRIPTISSWRRTHPDRAHRPRDGLPVHGTGPEARHPERPAESSVRRGRDRVASSDGSGGGHPHHHRKCKARVSHRLMPATSAAVKIAACHFRDFQLYFLCFGRWAPRNRSLEPCQDGNVAALRGSFYVTWIHLAPKFFCAFLQRRSPVLQLAGILA